MGREKRQSGTGVPMLEPSGHTFVLMLLLTMLMCFWTFKQLRNECVILFIVRSPVPRTVPGIGGTLINACQMSEKHYF